jgi:hypothetical protein
LIENLRRQIAGSTLTAGPATYVRKWHEGEAEGGAKPVRLCPCSSDVNLFRYGERIIDFNAEIPDDALDLCMS